MSSTLQDAIYATEETAWSDEAEAANGWSNAELRAYGIIPGQPFDVVYNERGNGTPAPIAQPAEVAA
jgi:hypothetical protein